MNINSLLAKFASARSKQAAPEDLATIQDLNAQEMTDRVMGAKNYPKWFEAHQSGSPDASPPYFLQDGSPGYGDGDTPAHPFSGYQDYGLGFNRGFFANPLWNWATPQTGTGLGGAAVNAALGYGATRLAQNYRDVFSPSAYRGGDPTPGVANLTNAAKQNLVGRLTGRALFNPFFLRANMSPVEPNNVITKPGDPDLYDAKGKKTTAPTIVSATEPTKTLTATNPRTPITSGALNPDYLVGRGITPGQARTRLQITLPGAAPKGGGTPKGGKTYVRNLPKPGVQMTTPALGGRVGVPTAAGFRYATNPFNIPVGQGTLAKAAPWLSAALAGTLPMILRGATAAERPSDPDASSTAEALRTIGPAAEIGEGVVTQPDLRSKIPLVGSVVGNPAQIREN